MKNHLEVIFRKFPECDVVAIFPDFNWDKSTITAYQHIGQHGGISKNYLEFTEPCEYEEYSSLLEELKIIYDEFELIPLKAQ